jgi:6-phosphogluconate dehydrogenase
MILTYAQGMAFLVTVSDKYEYHLDLEAVARIWQDGCVIRLMMSSRRKKFAGIC